MVDDDKNKGGNSEFDDESFDDIDFETADLDDDAAYDDLDADASDIDFDAENEDFGDEEWSEEEAQPARAKKGKKEKSLYTGDYKKPLLSFNTMVIVGAMLLGGSVLAYTVMSKSAEVASGKPSIFRSMLNIGEVMDGGIFGPDEKPADALPADAAQDTTVPATEQGFLDNPDVLKDGEQPAVTPDGTPPMPSPISASETTAAANEPLTPMPETEVVPVVPLTDTPAPRGPDEYVDADNTPAVEEAVAIDESTASQPRRAEDILKEAMANRQEKAEGKKPVKEETPPVVAPPVPKTEPVPEAPKPLPVVETPAPVVVAETSPQDKAKLEAATKAAEEANKKAEALQKKIDTLLARVDQMEGAQASAQENRSSELKEIQQTVKTLKQDIDTVKTAPARTERTVAAIEEEPEIKPAPVVKKPAKKAPKPAAKVASKALAPPAAASTGRWELRAAQPGKAWVSKPGARDMQGIVVGETLPGIGQVTAISYQNGRWTVQGTQGQILQ